MVVVEGVTDFRGDSMNGIEKWTSGAILERLRMAYPTRAKPWADPAAERVLEFEEAGRPARPAR